MNESNIEFCLMITELREKFSFKIKWKNVMIISLWCRSERIMCVRNTWKTH